VKMIWENTEENSKKDREKYRRKVSLIVKC